MNKLAVIWDLDDTLYLKSDCLRMATKQMIQPSPEQMKILEKAFPKYSDIYFDKYQSGEITFDENRIGRAIDTFKEIGVDLGKDEANLFQQAYEKAQYSLELRFGLEDLFESMKYKGIINGIITNGEKIHQTKKIEALQMHRWIDEKLIITSGEFGTTKPSLSIFQEMAQRIEEPCEMIYVGDDYINDIHSLKDTDWITIWFNIRHEQVEDCCADYVVESYDQLYKLFEEII